MMGGTYGTVSWSVKSTRGISATGRGREDGSSTASRFNRLLTSVEINAAGRGRGGRSRRNVSKFSENPSLIATGIATAVSSYRAACKVASALYRR